MSDTLRVVIKKEPGDNFKDYPIASHENTKRMAADQSQLFLIACAADKSPEDSVEMPFIAQVISSRIKHLDLPISFSQGGLLAATALCESPGQAVILLCDCLYHYEGKAVTSKEISDLYPWGFYTMPVVENIIDNFMKTRSHPWSRIY